MSTEPWQLQEEGRVSVPSISVDQRWRARAGSVLIWVGLGMIVLASVVPRMLPPRTAISSLDPSRPLMLEVGTYTLEWRAPAHSDDIRIFSEVSLDLDVLRGDATLRPPDVTSVDTVADAPDMVASSMGSLTVERDAVIRITIPEAWNQGGRLVLIATRGESDNRDAAAESVIIFGVGLVGVGMVIGILAPRPK